MTCLNNVIIQRDPIYYLSSRNYPIFWLNITLKKRKMSHTWRHQCDVTALLTRKRSQNESLLFLFLFCSQYFFPINLFRFRYPQFSKGNSYFKRHGEYLWISLKKSRNFPSPLLSGFWSASHCLSMYFTDKDLQYH